MTLVLVGWVDPLLYRLHQPLADREGHRGPCQLSGYQTSYLHEEALHLHHLLSGRRLLPACLVFRREADARREVGRRVRHHKPVPRPPLVGVAELEVG